MSTKPLQLEGLVGNKSRDHDEEELQELRRENQRLEGEVRQLRAEMEEVRASGETGQRVIRNLRDQLNPLHRALRAVFGEIELAVDDEYAAPVGSAEPTSGVPRAPQFDPRWEAWKRKFSGNKKGEIIDALLDHGKMNRNQIRVALKAGWSTVDAALAQLRNLGLIEKNGDHWTLKEL